MSAIAFTINKKRIVGHSDGVFYASETDQLSESECRKIFKVANNAMILWMGYGVKLAEHLFAKSQVVQCDTPLLANAVFNIIKQFGFEEEEMKNMSYAIFIAGFDEHGSPRLFQLFKAPGETNITSPKEIEVKEEITGCLADDLDNSQTSYQHLLSTYYPLYQDLEYASKEAFKKMVTDYEAAGKRVGGTVFTESLENCISKKYAK